MLQRGNGEVLTRVRLPPHLSVDGQSGLHPALLDACLHLYPALVDAYGDFTQAAQEPRRTHLPVGVERFRCACVDIPEVWVHGVRRQPANGDGEIVTIDIAIYQNDGRLRRRNRWIVAEALAAGGIEAAGGHSSGRAGKASSGSRPGNIERGARRRCGGNQVPMEGSARDRDAENCWSGLSAGRR